MKKILFSILLFALTTSSVQAASYSLDAGWNLVSADVAFSLSENDAVFANLMAGGAIYALNPKDKQYYGGFGSLEKLNKEFNKMEGDIPNGDEGAAALGFWVYTPRAFSVDVDFSAASGIETKFETTNYQFIRGWNLVGITELMLDKSLPEVKGTCEFDSLYVFESGQWKKHTAPDYNDPIEREMLGHAFAVKVANDCAFDFGNKKVAPSVPSVPSLPR